MIGWTTIALAIAFFTTRYGAAAWIALSGVDQTALLTTAWNRILYDPRWAIPASPTPAQLIDLAYAQHLTAWYMYTHISDEDRRKGLQAQAVIQAGIVQETYEKSMLTSIPLPPEALAILIKFFKAAKPFYAVDVDRREPVGADQDVTDVENDLNEPGIY